MKRMNDIMDDMDGLLLNKVRIVRSRGKDDQEVRDNVRATVKGAQITFGVTEDIKKGDYIYITDPKISSAYNEPLVIVDCVANVDPFGKNLSTKVARIVYLSDWENNKESARLNQQINVSGTVGTLAVGDITGDITNYNINATILLEALEKVIEESEGIPLEAKSSLLERLHEIIKSPYVKDISSTVIVSAIKSLIGI